MIIFNPGLFSFINCMALKPFMSGILTSMSTKSGSFSSDKSTASCPFFAQYTLIFVGRRQIEDKSKVVMIGDAFDTDLAGAEVAGLDAVFICGGIHAREIGFSKGMPDVQKLEDILRHYARSPKAILPSLVW